MEDTTFKEVADIVSKHIDKENAEALVESLSHRMAVHPGDVSIKHLPMLLLEFCMNDDILEDLDPQEYSDMMEDLITYAIPRYMDGLDAPWEIAEGDSDNRKLQKKVWDVYNVQKDLATLILHALRSQVDELVKSKKMEDRLRDSEKRFHRMLELSPDAVLIHADGLVMYVNNAATRLFGVDGASDLTGRSILDLIQTDYHEDHGTDTSGTGPKERNRLVKMDGTVLDIELTTSPTTFQGKNANQVVIKDISERLEAEIKLRESEERYRSLFDNMAEGVFQSTPDGQVIAANKAFLDIFNIESEQQLHEIDAARDLYVDPLEREIFMKELEDRGVLRDYELVMRTMDDRNITVLENVFTLRAPDGSISAYEGTITDITARKEAEAALRESEELNRSIVDNIGVGISVISPDMRLLSVNNQIREWFPNIDTSNRPICYEAYKDPPGKDYCEYCPTRKTLKDGKIYESVSETQRGGDLRNYKIVSTPLKDSHGEIVAAVELIEDITETTRMQNLVKESEEQFRDLVEKADIAIVIDDQDGKYVYWNKTFLDIYGFDDSDVKNVSIKDLVHPDDMEKVMKNHNDRMAGKDSPSKYTFRALKKTGEEIFLQVEAVPRMMNGKMIGTKAYIWDLTERIRAEQEYKDAMEKFEALFENTSDAIFVHEMDDEGLPGKMIAVNQKACDSLGYTKEELLGLTPMDITPKKRKDNMPDVISQHKGQDHFTFQGINVSKDGKEIPVEISAHMFKLQGKRVMMSLARDIRERQKMENELKASKEIYEDLVEQAKIAIQIDDRDGNFVYYNQSFLDLYGYTDAEMKKLSRKKLLHPDDYKIVSKRHNKRMDGKRPPSRYRFRGVRKDGEIITVEVVTEPIVEGGEVKGTRSYLWRVNDEGEVVVGAVSKKKSKKKSSKKKSKND